MTENLLKFELEDTVFHSSTQKTGIIKGFHEQMYMVLFEEKVVQHPENQRTYLILTEDSLSLVNRHEHKNKPYQSKTSIVSPEYEQKYITFKSGDRFENSCTGKTGTVRSLRNDEWERKYSKTRHYHVDYDDGSFETYQSELNMVKMY